VWFEVSSLWFGLDQLDCAFVEVLLVFGMEQHFFVEAKFFIFLEGEVVVCLAKRRKGFARVVNLGLQCSVAGSDFGSDIAEFKGGELCQIVSGRTFVLIVR
jgi:hypothetical protein